MPTQKYPKGYIRTYKKESGTKKGFFDDLNKACDAVNARPQKFLSKKEIEGPTAFSDLIKQYLSQGGKVKKYQEGYAEDSTIQSKYALEDMCAVSSAGKLRIDTQVF